MPELAVAAWGLVALAMPLDWWAVATGARRSEWVLKPLALAALLAAAALSGATGTGSGWWLLVALALSLAGDVALLAEGQQRFVLGLASFLLAHVAYVVSFSLAGLHRPAPALAGLVLVAGSVAAVGRRIVRAAAGEGGPALGAACAAYMLVIGVMVVAAWATGRPLVALGAAIFMASDTLLAWNRFVRPVRHAHLGVMATYHLGQVLIVLGLLR